MNLSWYRRRLSRMSPGEVAVRLRTALRQAAWRPSAGGPALRPGRLLPEPRRTRLRLARSAAPETARADLLAYADRLLAGDWPVFETARRGVPAEPDWFLDPLTGRRAPQQGYCFAVPHRRREIVGDLKHVWEPSRHQATISLATAWWLTGEARYAEAAARHLTSWWRDNPYLCGIHWTSGIELGLRLLSWSWIRALLADWPGCAALFDENPVFLEQLYGHQKYLAGFESPQSSSNNHLLAELAGLAVAASAFPWFVESAGWAAHAAQRLQAEVLRQTASDGLNREQASEYHRFVLELLWSAGLLAELAAAGFGKDYWAALGTMSAALGAGLDCRGREPRYGDTDGGRALAFDAPAADPVALLLGGAAQAFDAAPPSPGTVFDMVIATLGLRRPGAMPAPKDDASTVFAESGHVVLRAGSGAEEIWAHCDCGPLGYLSIAAHGHADALSVELRVGGVEVLADPGTYLYHADPPWRRYFKSTLAHNTLTVDGRDQAEYGGSFLWLGRADGAVEELALAPSAPLVCQARHDGYRRLADPAIHHRRTTLDPAARRLQIEDWLDCTGPHAVTLAFHLGPSVALALDGAAASLRWSEEGAQGAARMDLPGSLRWTAHRGEETPPLGWYSRRYGQREPITALIGRGTLAPGTKLTTRIAIHAV
jgi:hypothetical protein